MDKQPVLYIIVPCYNEEKVLPITAPIYMNKLRTFIAAGRVSDESRILYVNDGSKDGTWAIIRDLSRRDAHFIGIAQSRNRGHQNAVLAGLMEARERCDITISIDCDGQDDINAMDAMLDAWEDGCEIVYGVRDKRDTDTRFKRATAEGYYKLLGLMGVEVVFNHADYRLVSSRALKAFSEFHEVNLFLRGMFPLVGFKSTCVYYERKERMAGTSKYPLSKMLLLAFDGITSMSIRPIRLITAMGLIVVVLSTLAILWAVIRALTGHTVSGWTSIVCLVCFFGGSTLSAIGIVGEYVGKTYLEAKARPRYIISDRTGEPMEDRKREEV